MGTFIIPIYMAKGLEFDGVIIYNIDKKYYYIGSTRALHRLTLLAYDTSFGYSLK